MPYNVIGEQRNTGRTHFKKGQEPWNKNTKGVYSEAYREKISKGMKGRPSARKGVKLSDGTKAKIRKASKLQTNRSGPKSKPWSESRRKAQELFVSKPRVSKIKNKRKRKHIMKSGNKYHWLWTEIRKLIYKRDNWICRECGAKCHNKIRINCHHIDYDTMNNSGDNLITLCTSCHMKTNYNRVKWALHFKTKKKEYKGNISLCNK